MLLESNLFHAPTFLPHQLHQALQYFIADPRSIVRKIDQMSLAILEDLKTKAIAPMEGNQCAIDGLDPALITFLVTGRAQHHCDLLRRMLFDFFFLRQWDI